MDGMFYRRESEAGYEIVAPKRQVKRLLALTVAAALGAIAMMLALRWAGMNLELPAEVALFVSRAG